MLDKAFIIFGGLILLIVILTVIGIIYLSFWIPRRRGQKKFSLILPLVLIIVLFLFVFWNSINDSLFFSKTDVQIILSDYKFSFIDKFSIVSNKTDT